MRPLNLNHKVLDDVVERTSFVRERLARDFADAPIPCRQTNLKEHKGKSDSHNLECSALAPAHSARKFSHVLGAASAYNSNTIRPTAALIAFAAAPDRNCPVLGTGRTQRYRLGQAYYLSARRE